MSTTYTTPIQLSADMLEFARILHQGGDQRFTQDLSTKWLTTYWSRADEPLRLPPNHVGAAHYFSVNPITQRVTDADREKYTGKSDVYIEQRVASKNNTIAALNCLYREFDGKNFTYPTPAEIEAAYQQLLNDPEKAQNPEKALRNEARGAAESTKFKTNPDHYKALAFAHVEAMTPAPSVIVASGGGYNCYWLLDASFVIRTDEHDHNAHITRYAADIQRRWVKMDPAADQGVHDLRRIFRPVGTTNYKPAYGPNFPIVSFIKKDFDLRYSLAALVKLLPPVSLPAATITQPRSTVTSQAQQRTYEGDSVIYAYNAAHNIVDALLSVGYTQQGERLARPGGHSPSVIIDKADNRSQHWSSSDALCSEYWRRPFDVFCTYAHGGNVTHAVAAAAAELGMAKAPVDVTPIIAALRLWIKTNNLAAQLVGPGSKKLRLVTDAILDVMQEKNRLSIVAGKKRLAALAGVSPNTVKNVLALVNGKLFEVTPAEYGDQITLLSNCRLQEFDPALDVVLSLTTGGQKFENDENEYSPHKTNDAFAVGISRYMKDEIKRKALDKDITYLEAKEEYDRGLGEGVLLARDTSLRIGDMTAQEYAAETGLKLSTARAHLRRCEVMCLATSAREGSRGPKVYTFEPDFWQRVEAMTPSLRTYKMHDHRENKRLERAQQWTQAELEKAKDAGDIEQVTKLKLRFDRQVEKRIPRMASLHPELSMKEIVRIVRDVEAYKRSPKQEAAIKATRNTQRNEHRDTVRLIADLIAETLDAGVTKADVLATVCKFGFDADMVRSVLSNQHLIERAAMNVGAETLAMNIAAYKADGISRAVATQALEVAGFIAGEIERAWDRVIA